MKIFSLALLLAALSSLFAWRVMASGDEPDERPWNVVLISVDTLRPDHLGAYGYERKTSPVIDELAKRGALFEQAYSQAPKTAPSHMSILTGLYPDAHGVKNFDEGENLRLSDRIPTLATLLEEEGYRTAAFTSGGHVRPDLGFDQGFEEYGTTGGVKGIFRGAEKKAKEFAGDPFFLFIHTYEVHDPYVPPEGFRGRWTDASYDGGVIASRDELLEASGAVWADQHRTFWDRVDAESESTLR